MALHVGPQPGDTIMPSVRDHRGHPDKHIPSEFIRPGGIECSRPRPLQGAGARTLEPPKAYELARDLFVGGPPMVPLKRHRSGEKLCDLFSADAELTLFVGESASSQSERRSPARERPAHSLDSSHAGPAQARNRSRKISTRRFAHASLLSPGSLSSSGWSAQDGLTLAAKVARSTSESQSEPSCAPAPPS